MDSDVEVFRKFDDLLSFPMFSGIDVSASGECSIEAAIMGSEAGNPVLKECMEYYEGRDYILPDGSSDMTTLIPFVMADIYKKYGFEAEDRTQILSDGSAILSSEYFVNIVSSQYRKPNYAFHHNVNSWCHDNRGRYYRLFNRYGLLRVYKFIERILKIFRLKK